MRFEEDSCHNLVLSVIDDKRSIPHPIRISSPSILNHPIYSPTVLNPSEMALFYFLMEEFFIKLCLFVTLVAPQTFSSEPKRPPPQIIKKYLLMSLKPLNAIDLILTCSHMFTHVHSKQSQRVDCIALLINVSCLHFPFH